MGRRVRKKGRDVHGVIVLDKPAGLSSRQAVNRVNDMFHAKKIGHTGSLDPLATGVLPLVLGNATKFSQFLLESEKEYEVTVRLGVSTDSGDADGNVLEERDIGEISDSQLEDALDAYRGEILQIPPMFSALKHEGQPLYKFARKGLEVEREARKQTVYSIDVLEFDGQEIKFRLHCSKGTYVRTLVHDLGEDLGCGAHVCALRRTRAGPFLESQSVTVEQLRESPDRSSLDSHLLPVQSTVGHWPLLEINKVAAFHVRQGQSVAVSHAVDEGWVGLIEASGDKTQSGHFLGVGEVLDDGTVAPRRLIL